MYRNLHITIHEAAPGRRRRAAARRGGAAGWDPTEPIETIPDPSDPTEPLETIPDPSDPTEPLETIPDPSDPTEPLETIPDPSDPTEPLETIPDPSDPSGRWLAAYGGGAYGGYGPAAAVYESAGQPAARPHCCCCCPTTKATAAPRLGATPLDRSGFVIVRLAAGIDPSTAGSLWQLAGGPPELPALKAALELAVEGAEDGDEGDSQTQSAGAVRAAGLGFHRRRDKGDKDKDKGKEKGGGDEGGGEKPEPKVTPPPAEPDGVLMSRPLIDLDPAGTVARADQIEAIRALEARAALTSFKPLHSLTAYWRVDVRPYPDRIDEVVERFNRLAEVDLAYAELTAYDPQQPAAGYGDAFDEDQGYLADAPVGIGARWAWDELRALTPPPGTVRVCDLEQRWKTDHREFGAEVLNKASIVGGANRADGVTDLGHHGTAVLGQLAATGMTGGVTGSATGIGEFVLASHYWPKKKPEGEGQDHPFSDTGGHVASAIVNLLVAKAAFPLVSGDVLLLEVQRGRLPAEIDAADFDAVRLGAALGVSVVEAGGNGGVDLDRYVDPDTGRSLNRSDSRFRDSGAIVVGAARSALPHDRASFSNHGSRIDCYAWGDGVTSCGYGDLSDPGAGADAYYTNTFSGTSSAAPIIAGAAALVQALHEAVGGTRLLPRAMRSALSDRRSGTPQGRGVAGYIGVMPDLCALIRDRLQLVPDVYMRSRVGDAGVRPLRGGEISSSPDVLAWQGQVPDGTTLEQFVSRRFGEGATANSPAPGSSFPWDEPDDHPTAVYVRLRNRGRDSGQEVTVRLYASRAATLITPEQWRLFGEPKVSGVPQGDTLRVAGPVNGWKTQDLGGPPANAPWSSPGTIVPPVSFLAVHGPDVVMPPGPPYFDWAEYRKFLRGPGVAWRNVHKVRISSPPPKTGVELAFFIAGTPDHGRAFDFEVLQRLPAGVTVTLLAPQALAAKLRQRVHWERRGTGGEVPLPSRPRMALGRIELSAGCRVPAAFRLEADDPADWLGTGHSLAIRQLWRGEEVGRITWWFVGKSQTTGGAVDDGPVDPFDDTH